MRLFDADEPEIFKIKAFAVLNLHAVAAKYFT